MLPTCRFRDSVERVEDIETYDGLDIIIQV